MASGHATRFAYDEQRAAIPRVVAELLAQPEFPRLDPGRPIGPDRDRDVA